jgi:hypothetical protein
MNARRNIAPGRRAREHHHPHHRLLHVPLSKQSTPKDLRVGNKVAAGSR